MLAEEKLQPLPQIAYTAYRIASADVSTAGFISFETNAEHPLHRERLLNIMKNHKGKKHFTLRHQFAKYYARFKCHVDQLQRWSETMGLIACILIVGHPSVARDFSFLNPRRYDR